MTVNANDITVTMNGRTMVFPGLPLLFSFVAFARFPAIRSAEVQRVVDVGGCVGGYTLAGLLNFPNAMFDVIEPSGDAWNYLQRNLGHEPRVKLHPIAASDKSEMLTLSFKKGAERIGHASVYGEGIKAEKVAAMPLDDVIQGRVDVIKLDVEGHEYNVLQGAQRILREWHPHILLEIKNVQQQRAGRSEGELLDYLIKHGYKLPDKVGNDYWFEGGK